MCACASQITAISHPVPVKKEEDEPVQTIDISNIKETQDGPGASHLPDWLTSFISGGIAEVEKLDFYQDRYVFIGKNKGSNFIALNKWVENFTIIQDFPRLAAVRIEKRLTSGTSLYPDDEYGDFYEALVKKAFGTEYSNAVKEQAYWIKTRTDQAYNAAEPPEAELPEVYEFFVFVSIEKTKMQSIIRTMMSDTLATVTPTRAQNAAINRLRQTFFERF